MLKEKNELIARKLFLSLILDYEFFADEINGLQDYCSGRVLNDNNYLYSWTAATRAEAIDKFLAGTLQEV